VLGLSVSKAARDAGISRTTWIAVEAGSRETQSYNYAPIERVLRWEPGSIEAVLAGGEATPVVVQGTARADLGLVAAARGVVDDARRDGPEAILAGIAEILSSRFGPAAKVAMIEDVMHRERAPSR
jgi:hypothetical protein